MDDSMMPEMRRSVTRRQHTRLSAIDPLGTAATRAAERSAPAPAELPPGWPPAKPVKPITFDSAL
ncbi:hypothetical protein ACN6K9_006315 [Streptomyces sp. SAS_267]|uniref:hypothetical protein n=1 Tax=unclassified Streptomyces TaxID=2593676 RepID=UPI0036F655A2